MTEKIGKRTLRTDNVYVKSYSNVVGKIESEGPLSGLFDMVINDEYFGEKTYEKAETKMQKTALMSALQKGILNASQLDLIASGDLLNQCISSSYSVRDNDVPYIGLFGACSTMALSTLVAAMSVECGYSKYAAGVTSSHFCTAERQFRQPLEYGGQRPPSAQRTVTAAAAVILSNERSNIRVSSFTPGCVIDYYVTDANNMGAAMAPAALDTLVAHFKDTGRKPSYYDAILTGDLGYIGKEILSEMAMTKGYNIKANYNDCGVLMFDKEAQDTHSGGSGCACCATIFSGYLFNKLKQKDLKKILLIATGALTNSTSNQQGESIPGIAHAIAIESEI